MDSYFASEKLLPLGDPWDVWPVLSEDVGTGKCRLSAHWFQEFKICIGEWVLVQSPIEKDKVCVDEPEIASEGLVLGVVHR